MNILPPCRLLAPQKRISDFWRNCCRPSMPRSAPWGYPLCWQRTRCSWKSWTWSPNWSLTWFFQRPCERVILSLWLFSLLYWRCIVCVGWKTRPETYSAGRPDQHHVQLHSLLSTELHSICSIWYTSSIYITVSVNEVTMICLECPNIILWSIRALGI